MNFEFVKIGFRFKNIYTDNFNIFITIKIIINICNRSKKILKKKFYAKRNFLEKIVILYKIKKNTHKKYPVFI
jgi:hypothetical protein